MTTYDLECCFAALEELPTDQTARCLLFAADQTIHIWQTWARDNGVDDLSPAFLECLERHLRGEATSSELADLTEQLYDQLPSDLRSQQNPIPGLAGVALTNIGLIATERAVDVAHSIIQTAVTYAAAAHCEIVSEPYFRSLDHLTPCEWEFIERWWANCEAAFPALRQKLADPEWKPWWELTGVPDVSVLEVVEPRRRRIG